VFIIGHLRGECTRKIFPLERAGGKNTCKLKLLNKGASQGYRIYDIHGLSTTIASQAGGLGAKTGLYLVGNVNPSKKGMNGNVYDSRGLSPTLTTNKGEGTKIFIKPMLNSNKNIKVRKLTPLECFRLQGFPDSFYYKAKEIGISDSQLYKQAGNSVTVNVICAIVKKFV
jgi:DNA (cytosine-5)-methyltransferase 1